MIKRLDLSLDNRSFISLIWPFKPLYSINKLMMTFFSSVLHEVLNLLTLIYIYYLLQQQPIIGNGLLISINCLKMIDANLMMRCRMLQAHWLVCQMMSYNDLRETKKQCFHYIIHHFSFYTSFYPLIDWLIHSYIQPYNHSLIYSLIN